LVHWATVGLPKHYIQEESAYTVVDRIKDREVKLNLLMGGKRMLNKSFSLVLKLEAHSPVCKSQGALCTSLVS
jgi:hypothetical protein